MNQDLSFQSRTGDTRALGFAPLSERILELIRRPGLEPSCSEAEFTDLALNLFELQYEHIPVYRRLAQARGAEPEKITDWRQIPAVPTRAFQEWELSSLSEHARTRVFWSSGTTTVQRRSRHYHSADSLRIYESALRAGFERQVLRDLGAGIDSGPFAPGAWEFIALTPPAAAAPNSSLVHMFDTIQKAYGFDDGAFAGRACADRSWVIEFEAAVGRLERANRRRRPVLILGPAFGLVHLLDHLALEGRLLPLPTGSLVMETGGYKGRSRILAREELYGLIERIFAVPAARIIAEYGMAELSSQAYRRGSPGPSEAPFEFPPWVRVAVVSPETGTTVPDGGVGLVRVYDLANVYSVLAVQTEDLAIRRGTGFELVGRAPEAEVRGCSLMLPDLAAAE